jgi:hypothetical protein
MIRLDLIMYEKLKADIKYKDALIFELAETLDAIIHGEPKDESTTYPYAEMLLDKAKEQMK